MKLRSKFGLAPMLAVNNVAFRLLCREYGSSLQYSGMIDIEKYRIYDDFVEEERPSVCQLIGRDPEKFKEAAQYFSPKVDIIDINLGCILGDYLGKKTGAYFLKHLDQMEKFVSGVIGCVNNPMTAKIRLGWDDDNSLEIAKKLEDLGISAISVHARTKSQAYTGNANWNSIKRLKENLNIPVYASGDASTPEKAVSMLKLTGADLVLIGRAAMGNPFIFKQCSDIISKGSCSVYSVAQRRKAFFRFLALCEKYDIKRFTEIRDHALWFVSGLKDSSQRKRYILGCTSISQLRDIL